MISISVYVALALLSAVLPMVQARDIPPEIVVFRGHYIEYRAYRFGDLDPERALREAHKLMDEQRANHGSGLARSLGEDELIKLVEAKAKR